MLLTYDPKYNIAYIKLKEKTTQVQTLKISEELNIDLASDGTIYGIELLNAKEQLTGSDNGFVKLINNAQGTLAEVKVA